MLEEQIRQLDDNTAAGILEAVAATLALEGDMQTDLPADARQAMAAEFGVAAAPTNATAGDLARETLLLLARDPARQPALMNQLTGGNTRFGVDPITATAVITAALVVLQTEIKIERDKEGKWAFLLRRKPASDALLKAVLQKFSSLKSG